MRQPTRTPVPMNLSTRLFDDPRPVTYRIVFGVFAIIAAYAVIHDQVIVSIAPEHFTEYHDPVPGVTSPRGVALAWALVAAVVKGIPFGIACAWIGRRGHRRRVPVGVLLGGTFLIILLGEVLAVLAGLRVYRTGSPFYPGSWYPDHTLPILITQTVQITCYLSISLVSMGFLAGLAAWRRRGELRAA